MSPIRVEIPRSVQTEHEAIHNTLKEATRAMGRVGSAAQELAKILHPHFVREEEIALPPLGLLSRLAGGDFTADMADILPMTDALKRELPQMLEEHKAIRAAVENLRVAARAENGREVRTTRQRPGIARPNRGRAALSGRHPCRRDRSRSTPPDIAVLDARRRSEAIEIHDVTALRSCRSYPGRLP